MPATRNKPVARIVLVLHAHLPYVRIPELRFPLEELWLFQNLTECYIPLLLMLRELMRDIIDFRITLSFSPTLIAMLNDDYFRTRYHDYLDTLVRMLGRITASGDTGAAGAALHLESRILRIRDFYASIGGDLVGAYRSAAEDGRINIITTCATHALLPGFRFSNDLVQLQIETGLRYFREAFSYDTRGLWLPEMGYYARLDEILRDCGIDYTFLDAHSVYRTPKVPERGIFYPGRTDAGTVIFPRDVALSGAIWSKGTGYPGDSRYREFHYDYIYSLADSVLAEEGLDRLPFGLKLYRITGGNSPKEFYRPGEAQDAVREHAADFTGRMRDRMRRLESLMDGSPVFTLPFDMELFGHWWFEGPEFLSLVIRDIAASPDLSLASPEEFTIVDSLDRFTPAESSWGRNGYFETWLTPECLNVYPEIAELFGRLRRQAKSTPHREAFQAALREILLAQSSDWPFFIAWDSFRDYGKKRLLEHLGSAKAIIDTLESGTIDEDFIRRRAELYPLFSFPGHPSTP